MKGTFAAAAGFAALLHLLAPASGAAVTVTIRNADPAGNQASRFDVDGNAIDAHDGSLRLFGDTYHLYGTSYACGYEYHRNAKFCGFKVYTSPDLVHWTDRGHVVPPGDCQYCFRPHVIYNEATRTYVLWADGGGGYMVYTSPTPTGLFTRRPNPTLAVGGYVDLALYKDDDGKGYVIHNSTIVPAGMTADMVVEPLTDDYLTTTGRSARLGLGDVEGFSVFRREGRYHALMSDPSCAYCAGATGEMTATDLLGSWSGAWYDPNGYHQSGRHEPRHRARIVNADNCGGQPHSTLPVDVEGGGRTFLFMSDRWNNRQPNEALANFFIGPLSFAPNGDLKPFHCVDTFDIALEVGRPGAYKVSPQVDATSGFDNFRHYCDITSGVLRRQSFTPTRSDTLLSATITTFRSGTPDAPLVMDLMDDLDEVIHTATFPVDSVPWAPKVLAMRPGLKVVAGKTYSIRIRTTSSTGCYGFEYNDWDPYAGGMEDYSTNGGATYTAEPKRDLKFTVEVAGTRPVAVERVREPLSGSAGPGSWALDLSGTGLQVAVPPGMAGLEMRDLQGRKVWAARVGALNSLVLPGGLGRGLVRLRWIPAGR